MTDKLKELLRDELAYGGQPISCQLGMVARCICEDCRSVRIGEALNEPAVEAAEIEVVGFELCVDGYSPVLIRDESHADREFEYYKGLGMKVALNPLHRRILAGVNQQAGSGVLFSKGFTTLETGDGKYRIVTNYQNRDNAWSDYLAISGAAPLPPSPAAKAGDL